MNEMEERAYNLIVEKIAWEHTGRCAWSNRETHNEPIDNMELVTRVEAQRQNSDGWIAYPMQAPYHLSDYQLNSAIKTAFELTYYRLTLNQR